MMIIIFGSGVATPPTSLLPTTYPHPLTTPDPPLIPSISILILLPFLLSLFLQSSFLFLFLLLLFLLPVGSLLL
jgi:hypothetical protein